MRHSSVITCCIAALVVAVTLTVAVIGLLVFLLVLTVRPDDGNLAEEDEPGFEPDPKPVTLPVGEPWNRAIGGEGATDGTTTVLGFEQPVPGLKPAEDGAQWAQFEVEVCNTYGPTMSVSRDDWAIRLADGGVVHQLWLPDDIDPPAPEFPAEASLTAGHCVRGKILYAVAAGERVTGVWHRGSGAPVIWTLPHQR